MGLDMHLSTSKGKEVGYWRKANQIHNWFVQNCQKGIDQCQETKVTMKQLAVLLSLCKEVLASCKLKDGAVINGYTFERGVMVPIIEGGKEIEDPSVAKKLLPVSSGFFFGSTNYDQYYYRHIENTVEILEKAMKFPEGTIFIYRSSW